MYWVWTSDVYFPLRFSILLIGCPLFFFSRLIVCVCLLVCKSSSCILHINTLLVINIFSKSMTWIFILFLKNLLLFRNFLKKLNVIIIHQLFNLFFKSCITPRIFFSKSFQSFIFTFKSLIILKMFLSDRKHGSNFVSLWMTLSQHRCSVAHPCPSDLQYYCYYMSDF